MKPLVVCLLTAITAFADVDLRPEFEKLHLSPRSQGARPTCSVFAVTQALEFTIAKSQAATGRLSPEYLIWAAKKPFDQDLLFSLRSEINRRKKGNLFTQAGNPFSEL